MTSNAYFHESDTWNKMLTVASDKDYLRAAEAASMLHVSPKTVSRWAKEGKVAHIVTLGGHRRFSRAEIERLLERPLESTQKSH